MKVKYHRLFLYLLLRGSVWGIAFLPRSLSHFFFSNIAPAVLALLPKERKRMLSHLEFAYGDALSLAKRKAIAREVMVHFALVVADMLAISRMRPDTILKWVIPDERTEQALGESNRTGQGLIIASGHFGSWELLAAFVQQRYPHRAPAKLVARRIYYEPFNRLIVGFRAQFGLETVYRDASFRTVLRELKRGDWVGVLIDQDVDSIPGVFVPFFDKPAYTTNSAAKMALAAGVPILPCFLIRDGKRYRTVASELLWPDQSKPREEEVLRLTTAYTRAMEAIIREYPAQWAWMHRRWKTQPAKQGRDA